MEVIAYHLVDDGSIPNHPMLPLLVYLGALKGLDAGTTRERLRANGWGGDWVNGVYTFHHFHSTAHEVLVVTRGTASLLLGGERGQELTAHAGDALLLPAGTGHRCLSATPGFEVVGAYPPGQEPDLCRPDPAARPLVLGNIRRVPLPATDPVTGGPAPLLERWSAG
ncbi:MAG TPA: cupin domain-containing protein [Deinococcales bacterium]|nr:cupin domain-containing protein [Deinococcales bacterium]